MVAATASGQFHLDAVVCLEKKHFLQGLSLRGTTFFLLFLLFSGNSDFTIKDSLLKNCTTSTVHTETKLSAPTYNP